MPAWDIRFLRAFLGGACLGFFSKLLNKLCLYFPLYGFWARTYYSVILCDVLQCSVANFCDVFQVVFLKSKISLPTQHSPLPSHSLPCVLSSPPPAPAPACCPLTLAAPAIAEGGGDGDGVLFHSLTLTHPSSSISLSRRRGR
jgi:hypothetical protein